jgi:hypothetical protein
MQHKWLFFGTLSLALLLQITPVQPRARMFHDGTLTDVPIPAGVTLQAPRMQADLDQDGALEIIELEAGEARILSSSTEAWHSPPGWQVAQAEMTDLDRDGAPELALLVWRPFRPWPVDQWLPEGGRISTFHDASGDSCQIILIGWRKGSYRELWAGSALAEPVRSFAAADLDGDGRQELITLDGRYSEPRSAPARQLKVWEWNGFGFSNVYRLDGRFTTLTVMDSPDGEKLLLIP